MSIRVGDTLLTEVYMGDERVTQIYLGDVLVYQLDESSVDGQKTLAELNKEDEKLQ